MALSAFILLTAAVFLVSVTHANPIAKPEVPLTMMFAEDHLLTTLRSKFGKRSSSFTGAYTGKYSHFGSKGTYGGKFSGIRRGKRLSVNFGGKARGKCDMLGSKGRYTAKYAGKFFAVGNGKAYRAKWNGRCDFTYTGTFAGMKKFAKAVGTFSGSYRNGKIVIKETGKFSAWVGGKRVKGAYKGFFDGTKFAAGMKGTVDGKKFFFKYAGMFEGIEKMMQNEGSYTVTSNGKKFSGKFNTKKMLGGERMLPLQ